MLRFLGFLTGSALTAALALAIVDPVTLESLRRSAATLFLGVDSAVPAPTRMAEPAADDAAPPTPAGTGSPRSRLLAALPGAAQGPAARPATSTAASAAATLPSGAAVATVPSADRQPSAGGLPAESSPAESSPADGAERSLPDVAGRGGSGTPAAGRFDPEPSHAGGFATGPVDFGSTGPGTAEPGPIEPGPIEPGPIEPGTTASGASGFGRSETSVAGMPSAGADRAVFGPGVRAPNDGPAETQAAMRAPAAAIAPVTAEGASPAGVSGSNLEALPPPPGAGGAGGWHAFWTPFRSEASATGFARHLERATGESYQVVRTGPGAYRVAFWHEGEDERSRRLLVIEQASGLSLRGGTL